MSSSSEVTCLYSASFDGSGRDCTERDVTCLCVAVAENGTLRRKVSITGRILKSKNSEEQVAQLHVKQDSHIPHITVVLLL